jgi:hypothetical protein
VNTPPARLHWYDEAIHDLKAEVVRLREERDRLMVAVGDFLANTSIYRQEKYARESFEALALLYASLRSLPDREDATQPITCRRHGKRDCPYCLTVPWPDREDAT